jgi:hypothetical protein
MSGIVCELPMIFHLERVASSFIRALEYTDFQLGARENAHRVEFSHAICGLPMMTSFPVKSHSRRGRRLSIVMRPSRAQEFAPDMARRARKGPDRRY